MEMLFTTSSILDLLYQIDELSEYDIGISETLDNKIQLTIGDSIYEIEPEKENEITVEEDVIDTVEEINQEAYQDLIDQEGFEYNDQEPVESGLIKEAVKSLLLGGAIKLASKMLK